MSTTLHDPCPRCAAPLPAYSLDAEHLTCAACGASLWRARPRPWHPLRRDGEVWSPPPHAHAPRPTPAPHPSPEIVPAPVAPDVGPHHFVITASSSASAIEAVKTVIDLCGLRLLDAKHAVTTPGTVLTTRAATTRDAVRRRFETYGYTVEFRDA